MIRFISNLFLLSSSSAKQQSEERAIVHFLVRHYTRGSTRLKEGRYLTTKEAERLKKSAVRCRL